MYIWRRNPELWDSRTSLNTHSSNIQPKSTTKSQNDISYNRGMFHHAPVERENIAKSTIADGTSLF